MAEESLFNLKELDDVFTALRQSTKRSIVISAFRKSVKPVLDEAKSNLGSHRRTGQLMRALQIRPINREVGIRFGTRKGKGIKGWYGHIIEHGTIERFRTTKTGKKVSTGKIKPTNFFANAINNNRKQVEDSVREEIFMSFDRYIKRQLSKSEKK